jgi:hypothetical protein
MSGPEQPEALPELRESLAVDRRGQIVAASPGATATPEKAAALTQALSTVVEVGGLLGLGTPELVHLRGGHTSSVAAVRGDGFLRLVVDPARGTGPAEKAARAWIRGGPPPPAARPVPPPPLPAGGRPLPARPAATAAGVPAQDAAAQPAVRAAPAARDAWAALRHALGRAQLTEAAALRAELPAAANPARAGCEPVTREDCERVVQGLLEGIGSVMAGDGVGGARILKPHTGEAVPNLSFRWLALQWSARAAVRSGAIPAARGHIQGALTVARQLDVEARAMSQWTAAEVLAHDGDAMRALAWAAESRQRFERARDRWGIGQTFLTEARVLSTTERPDGAAEAARHAAEHLPDSEEPVVLLARLAVIRGDGARADELLRPLRSQAAEKVRALIEAIRAGHVSSADAVEFLREQDAAPSQRALRALGRIASTAPAFPQAREALAWMLLRIGKYEEAGGVFRALLAQRLSAADRASVMLGLGCVANATKHAPLADVVAPAPADLADEPPAPGALPPTVSQVVAVAAPAANGGADAVLSGDLASFTLPDLLEFLRTASRTGLLVCSSPAGMGALRFRNGRITAASSPSAPGIGEFLVRAGRTSAGTLAGLAATVGEKVEALAPEHILRAGLADARAVEQALTLQLGVALRELIAWKDGEFAFNRDTRPEEPQPAAVAVDAQAVLLDVVRQLDEAGRAAPAAAQA